MHGNEIKGLKLDHELIIISSTLQKSLGLRPLFQTKALVHRLFPSAFSFILVLQILATPPFCIIILKRNQMLHTVQRKVVLSFSLSVGDDVKSNPPFT